MNKPFPIQVEVGLPDSKFQEFLDALSGLPKETVDSFRERFLDLIRNSRIQHVRGEDDPTGVASRILFDFPIRDFEELIAAARRAA